MLKNNCIINLRVWGDFACMTRPELKAERVSYPILTPSAARGVLEAVYYEPQMFYIIHEIAVVKRGRWFSFRRNEVKKVVSLDMIAKAIVDPKKFKPILAGGGADDGTQRGMLALADVEYLIKAEILLTNRAEPRRDSLDKYLGIFTNRASKGKCFHRPYLGCREFAADFEFIPDHDVQSIPLENWPQEDLGIMLYDVFDPRLRFKGANVEPDPVFFNAKVVDSKMNCRPDQIQMLSRRNPVGGA